MKYELPENIKKHYFFCQLENGLTGYNKCLKCNGFECWKNQIIQDFKLDCDVENERNAESYVDCPNCKSKYIVGCAFDSYMCEKCGTNFTLSKEQQKEFLGEKYIEIDENDLTKIINEVKK